MFVAIEVVGVNGAIEDEIVGDLMRGTVSVMRT